MTGGGWSNWESWRPCGATCEGDLRYRQRQCDNLAPSPSGRNCVGSDVGVEMWNNIKCEGRSRRLCLERA